MPQVRVADSLLRVRERIDAACVRAGRPPRDVRLVAVTKFVPLPMVADACAAGQWDLGENRVQPALERMAALPPLLAERGLEPQRPRWHFIGHLQSNKAGKAGGRFALLHGVDSLPLAQRLAASAAAAGRAEAVLLEVNISGEPAKNGLDPAQAPDVLAACARLPGLQLRGLMGMARLGAGPAELSRSFALLRRLVEQGRRDTGLALPELSMGMSGDFEAAVAEGATLVRIGTAIFGAA